MPVYKGPTSLPAPEKALGHGSLLLRSSGRFERRLQSRCVSGAHP